MQAWSRRLLPVLALVVAVGCTPAAPTPSPLPSFRCTPEAGGAEFDCSQAQYDEMVAKDALYAEAEAVYRTYLAEDARILRLGGVDEPTKVLLETTAGDFLAGAMADYRDLVASGTNARGNDPVLKTIERAPGNSKAGSLAAMVTCVDGSSFEFIRDGKSVSRGTAVQNENYFSRVDGVLKVIGADGRQVEAC